MIILDENIPSDQRELLASWGVRVRQIGYDVARNGLSDTDIISFLMHQRRPTFVTRDQGFYDRRLRHAKYCLVYLTVEKHEVARFVRKLLRHAAYKTHVQRMGSVVRVSRRGTLIWRRRAVKPDFWPWE